MWPRIRTVRALADLTYLAVLETDVDWLSAPRGVVVSLTEEPLTFWFWFWLSAGGVSAGGVSAGGVSAGGVSAGGVSAGGVLAGGSLAGSCGSLACSTSLAAL